ncbi:MAG: polyprenyl synthetase family protein [Chloroflexota bacterium]
MSQSLTFLEPVAAELHEVESRMRHVPLAAHPTLLAALQHILASGGKRVRPALTLLVGQALSGPTERLIDLAAAVEMLHTASLVHDDIIDGSLMRRGAATLNATWSPGATILTGDFIFARAAQLAAATQSVRVMSLFAETLMVICNGELRQLFEGRAGERVRPAYYERIYAKTGSLFALASEAAAVLSTTDETLIAQMRDLGKHLGMAFQIVDDILDFAGEESAVGKPVGSDLRQGLVTLPTLCFLERYPADGRVLDVLDGHRRDPERLERAIQAIRTSEAMALSLDEARLFTNKARATLEHLPAGQSRQALSDLAGYLVERVV